MEILSGSWQENMLNNINIFAQNSSVCVHGVEIFPNFGADIYC